MKNKEYDISLHFGNMVKTISEMDRTDVYYGLSDKDKNELLWALVLYYKDKEMDNTQYYEPKTPQQLQGFDVYYHPYETFELNGTRCYQSNLTINDNVYVVYMTDYEVDRYITNVMMREVEND